MIRERRLWIGALVGLAVTTALMGLLYLLAQLELLSFVPLDIAQAIIRVTPGLIATQGIEALGSVAKVLIEISGVVLMLGLGASTGALVAWFRWDTPTSNGLLVGLAALVLTVLIQTLAGNFPDVIALASTALLMFAAAFGLVITIQRALGPAPAASQPDAAQTGLPRRTFLRNSGGVLLTVALGSFAIGELIRRTAATQLADQIARGETGLPGAALPVPAQIATEPGAGIGVAADPAFKTAADMRPEATPSDQLYVVAAAVRAPRVHVDTWQLTVTGLVDRPLTFSYDQLRELPRVDQTSTLTCVSNEVGGALTGNITWSGVRLRDLLQMAGVTAGAVDVVLRSVENYSDSIPLDRALQPQTLIVYGMNGTTLLTEHGFPVRLIVPGIYGMKNVKWLQTIEVVGTDAQGYWQQRGWSDTAIVKTFSTIDTGNRALDHRQPVRLENGMVLLGGYAFAGDRGIQAVDVQIDGGAWQAAQLKRTVSALTWQPWSFAWPASPGAHTIRVRATDRRGQLQTDAIAPPHPDGSSGWHTLEINVEA